ncbi:MAG: hypothetical protein ACC700_18090 [Anaerolineales bacterium]
MPDPQHSKISPETLTGKQKILAILLMILIGSAFLSGIILLIFVGEGENDVQTAADTGSTPETMFPERVKIPGWEDQDIGTVCLKMEQSFPRGELGALQRLSNPLLNLVNISIEPKEFLWIFDDAAEEILAGLNIEVVASDSTCDAVLAFTFEGHASGANYKDVITGIGSTYCYTGSAVEGIVHLSGPDEESFESSVSGKYPPSSTLLLSSCPEKPEDAPFEKASAKALIDGLSTIWGPQAAIEALGVNLGSAVDDQEQEGFLDDAARDYLIQLGEEAISYLIQALGEGKGWFPINTDAGQALKTITGLDFGNNIEQWQDWWEEQADK